jgi:hypothetical protein
MSGGDIQIMRNQLSSMVQDTSNIAAYIPVYDNGNAVMAITKDGQTMTVDKSIKSLIKNLLNRNAMDFSLLRKSLSRYTGNCKYMPIPLSTGSILIPVKVRKRLAVNDGAFAYIDLLSIHKVSMDKASVITLKCGRDIKTLESEKTVRSRMKTGFIIMEWFSSRVLEGSNLKECISGISGEYEKAATKGDITLLAYEIMKLRSMLNK